MGKFYLELFLDLFQGSGTLNFPFSLGDFDDILGLCSFLLIVQVAYQSLHDIVQGDDTADTAVLIDDDVEILAAFFHLPEHRVGLHALRNERRLVSQVFHDVFAGALGSAEIIAGVENGYYIVEIFLADQIMGVPALLDGLFPDGAVIIERKPDNIGPVGADLSTVISLKSNTC